MAQADVSRSLNSYSHYASNFLWIKTKGGALQKFTFNEAQQKIDNKILELQKKGDLLRIIILKARQEGMSTYSEGYIFRASHLSPNNRSVIIAHEVESGTQIFNMCKLFYECLPPYFRPMTRHSNRKEIVFENPKKDQRYDNPGLRSSVEVYTAGKFNVARGSTIHCLHASELASWPFPEDTVPALMPTIPKTPNSIVIFESTAKGVGNYFHSEWLRAKDGDSNFYPFFLSWFDLSEYSYPFRDEKSAIHFLETCNDEEKELLGKYGLSAEQLLWRRMQIKDLSGDVELFRQEFPSNDTEAFIVSGTPIFDRRKLRELYMTCTDPKIRGELERAKTGRYKFRHRSDGRLKVWETPIRNAEYVIGVDVSEGIEGGDFSCAQVLKRLPYPNLAKQVAEWHGKCDAIDFAHMLEKIGRMYNNALVAVEVSGYGLATQVELTKIYWNIYRWQRFDNLRNKYTDKIGWETNVRSKKQLIALATHCVYEGSAVINSPDLITEMMVFVHDGANASAEGGFDDRVMAWMISLFTLHQTYTDYNEQEEEAEQAKEFHVPIETTHRIDPNYSELFEYGKSDSYDESWLNY